LEILRATHTEAGAIPPILKDEFGVTRENDLHSGFFFIIFACVYVIPDGE
jgi:hypothetical protein